LQLALCCLHLQPHLVPLCHLHVFSSQSMPLSYTLPGQSIVSCLFARAQPLT
jgi:hypothetical protein